MEQRRVCVVLALLILSFCQLSQTSGGEDLTAAEVTGRLVRELAAVRSLHITWHKELGNERWAGKNVWAYQGSKFLDCGAKRRLGGPGPYWLSFDGEYSHQVKYWQLDRTQVAEVQRSMDPNVPDRDFGLRPLGLNLPGTKETLLTIVEQRQPSLGSTEIIEGEKAYRLDFGSLADVWRSPHTLTVWVDSLRFLPRQIELHPSHSSKPPFRIDVAKGETAARFTIGEFRKFLDESHGEQRWFPARVLIGPTALVFDEVRLNPDLPDETFLPPTPPGTIIRTGNMAFDPVSKVLVPETIVAGGEEGRKVLAARHAIERQESDRITEEIARGKSLSKPMPTDGQRSTDGKPR